MPSGRSGGVVQFGYNRRNIQLIVHNAQFTRIPVFSRSRPHLADALRGLRAAACGTTDKYDETSGWSAGKPLFRIKDAQGEGNWGKAAKYLEKLEARFPYGRFAQQAQLELGYVYWKGNEPGSALAACDRFIKLHPAIPPSITSIT